MLRQLAKMPSELDGLTGTPSGRFNVLPHTPRSTAILHRLYVILTKKIPESNEEFIELIERLRRIAGAKVC